MSGYFVTGTDTGVGKTLVTTALVAGMRSQGMDAVPMKPVQTGCVGNDPLRAPDLDIALKLSGYVADAAEEDQFVPYKFTPPCSPHLAAAEAGATISMDRILKAFQYLQSQHEHVIVEGSGGVLVPLNQDELMIDLMVRLALPVLVVARPTLGTLNHTLLTLEALRHRALDVRAVILSAGEGTPLDTIETDNMETIRRAGGVPVLGPLPHLLGWKDGTITGAELVSACGPHLETLFET